MSFKSFVYYCALCGGWAGFLSWVFSMLLFSVHAPLLKQTLIGCFLGFFLSAAIATVDSWLNDTGFKGAGRVGLAVSLSVIGSMFCALIGQAVYGMLTKVTAGSSTFLSTSLRDIVTVITWVVVGIIIGGSIGLYDLSRAVVSKQGQRFAINKIIKACVGGAIGGFVGGLFLALCESLELLTYSKRAVGFVILGMSIGLLIGVAQVILKEAWLRVEQGFRPGRELMLAKEETVIGRAENCDLGLYGDNAVERLHARIRLKDGRYMLYDESTPAGTFVNDQRISGPTPLRSGDVIRLGRNVLVFGERQKRPA